MNKLLLPVLLAAGLARPAAAQTAPTVYAYAEQMPQLPGTSSRGAVKAAIERNVRLPAADVQRRTYGRILVTFVVTETGAVAGSRIIQNLTAGADAAVLAAVQQLPRFAPGQQAGRPVSVALTIPVDVGKEFAAQAEAEAAERNRRNVPDFSDLSGEGNKPAGVALADQVYTYVEQMPSLPGGAGPPAVAAAIGQRLVVPVGAPEGKVFVKFVVGKDGRVKDIEVIKSLSATADAAVVAAVRKLPTFEPGKQNGQLVQVSLTLPIVVRPPAPGK